MAKSLFYDLPTEIHHLIIFHFRHKGNGRVGNGKETKQLTLVCPIWRDIIHRETLKVLRVNDKSGLEKFVETFTKSSSKKTQACVQIISYAVPSDGHNELGPETSSFDKNLRTFLSAMDSNNWPQSATGRTLVITLSGTIPLSDCKSSFTLHLENDRYPEIVAFSKIKIMMQDNVVRISGENLLRIIQSMPDLSTLHFASLFDDIYFNEGRDQDVQHGAKLSLLKGKKTLETTL